MAAKNSSRAITTARADNTGDVPPEFRPTQEAESDPVTEPVEGVVTSKTPATDALLAWCEAMCQEGGGDSQAGLESIIRQALEAERPEDVLRTRLAQGAVDFIGVPLRFDSFTIHESTLRGDKGWPYFVSMNVVCGDPVEARVITTSSVKILAQVAAFEALGEWPQIVSIAEMRQARKGENAPLGLVPVEISEES